MLSRVLYSAAQSSCRSRSLATAPRSALATNIQQPSCRLSSTVRHLSSSSSEASVASSQPQSRFAIVDHSEAYVASMRGPHGKQLELAQLDGMGRDDPPFNPFWDDEEEEEEDDDEIDEMEGDDEDEQETAPAAASAYNNDGSLPWKKGQLATFRAGAPAGGMFAVVELAGSQHKVTTDDVLNVNLLKPVEVYKVGSVHTLRDVMMVGSSHQTAVGMPYVTGAEVDVMVEEITQDEKVVVFKKRRRKNYKRKKGHRRDLTLLRILDIRPPPEIGSDHEHVLRENPTV